MRRESGSRYWVSGYPRLLAQWHPDRNADLLPSEVSYRSNRPIWWRCAAGRDHEWRVAPKHRTGADAGRRLPDLRSRDHFTVPGGVGGAWSLWMHDERSKSMNSSAFSCGESSVVLQPPGHAGPGVSPTPAETWRSL